VGTQAKVKQNDSGNSLTVDFDYPDSSYDLTDSVTIATPVVFIMTAEDAVIPTIDRASASVLAVDTATRIVTVEYVWQVGDTAAAGRYYAEFEFDLSGNPVTAPGGGYLTIDVIPDLG
jgi:hypothetical protein